MQNSRLFAHPSFVLLWLSGFLVTIGAAAFPIALAVTVLDEGGNATTLGLILASRILSGVVLAGFGGVWADRFKRKYIMIIADVTRGFLTLALFLVTTAGLPTWTLAVIVFLMGTGEALGMPASAAILPSLLPNELLPAGNALRSVTARVGSILGPAIGGLFVALVGSHKTFLITAVGFLIGTALLFPLKEGAIESKPQSNSFFADFAEGIRTVRNMPWVAAIIVMAAVQLMVVIGVESVMLPVVTKSEFEGNFTFAAASAAAGIGGAVSALVWARIKSKKPGLVSVIAWLFFAVGPLALAFPFASWWVIFAYFVLGASTEPFGIYWSTAIQREVPQELQGRVFSVDHMGSLSLLPLGMALAGPTTEAFGIRNVLIFVVAFHIVTGLAVLAVPGVTRLKTPAVNSSVSEQN